MTAVRRSALVERPAATLFDRIEAAERHAEFLPWCAGATILERGSSRVPFSRFEGEWSLRALGPDGCRVDFALDDAFVKRALAQPPERPQPPS